VAPEFIVSLALSPSEPNNMIFASGGTQSPVPGEQIVVKISTDGGYTWNDVTSNIPGEPRWITRVVCDPVDANTMYVLRTGFSPGNKVWKTANLGWIWTNISGDLPDLPCSDLFIDPENTDHLYVANDIGIYHSGNGGVSWEYASIGVPYIPAIDFDYVKIGSDRYLRVGTHGRSIYQTLLPNYCLPEGIGFTTQEQIDNFQTNYPGCTEIEGDVYIGDWMSGSSINNLDGLGVLTSVAGALQIGNNPSLTSMLGLDNLNTIGGDLWIYWNGAMTSLTGLDNLNSIGGILGIDDNDALTNLMGLNNLSSIGGDLRITNHDALASLTGLDNIQEDSIDSLYIFANPNLSDCDVLSICTYLNSPNGTISIHDNAPGCNSQEEVEAACLTTVEKIETRNGITIIPNPSNDKITITSSALTGIIQLSIFNVNGEKVIEKQLTDKETQLDISALPRGVYFVRVQNETMVEVGKMVKE
jgi:hypothetical protein